MVGKGHGTEQWCSTSWRENIRFGQYRRAWPPDTGMMLSITSEIQNV